MKAMSHAKLRALEKDARGLYREYVASGNTPREARAMFQMGECVAADAWDEEESVLTDEAVELDSEAVTDFLDGRRKR